MAVIHYNRIMVSTRTLILNFLDRHQSATVRDLSIALHLTPANIRHHLELLRKEGVVDGSTETIPLPKGRPTRFFYLASKKQANNYINLSKALLEFIQNTSTAPPAEIYKKIAEILVKYKQNYGTTITQRLIQAITVLNTMKYEASWEAEKDAPIIKFNHCPYFTLVSDYPELCEIDCYLLSSLTGKQAFLISKLHQISPNQITCKFKIIP